MRFEGDFFYQPFLNNFPLFLCLRVRKRSSKNKRYSTSLLCYFLFDYLHLRQIKTPESVIYEISPIAIAKNRFSNAPPARVTRAR